ncbi:MAG: putative Mn2+ efflux pump MntP [Dehalococcoidia bacterium]|nr:putative Mn2+ efflux pump MntP [Dehalococcoidia bacterium]
MEFLSLFFVALSLSADCFAVALSGSISMRTVSRLRALRTSLAFGFFQFLMPVLGWLAGRTIVEVISAYDHWVAFALLAFVGGRMVWQSLRERDQETLGADITRGFLLLTLSVATSLDALAVGLSFAFLQVDIVRASLTIGIVAFLATAIGFLLGRKVGKMLGRGAKLVGGLVLLGIGVSILLTHIL